MRALTFKTYHTLRRQLRQNSKQFKERKSFYICRQKLHSWVSTLAFAFRQSGHISPVFLMVLQVSQNFWRKKFLENSLSLTAKVTSSVSSGWTSFMPSTCRMLPLTRLAYLLTADCVMPRISATFSCFKSYVTTSSRAMYALIAGMITLAAVSHGSITVSPSTVAQVKYISMTNVIIFWRTSSTACRRPGE